MNSFLIYTKDNCPYCVKAKTLLSIKKMNFVESKIGEDITREDFMSLFPDQKKVPLVFYDDNKIGGYDELVKWFDSRK